MTSAKRILLIEDAEDIAETVSELLRGEGYEIVSAGDGREALALLRSGSPLPSLILLDLMMPGMDGFEFRAAQLADPALAAIPVVLMSAGNDLDVSARELEAHGHLRKPFKDIDSILGAIARFF